MKKEQVILKRCDLIKENLSEISNIIKNYNDENNQYMKKIYLRALERLSEEIIESAIKINLEILKIKNISTKTYFESFMKLKEFNIFEDEEILKKLSSSAGFRNRLAHEYLDLDEKISFETIKKIPKLYNVYLEGIVKFVEKNI